MCGFFNLTMKSEITQLNNKHWHTLTFMNLSLEQVASRRRRAVLVNWQWLTCSSCSSSNTLNSMACSTFHTSERHRFIQWWTKQDFMYLTCLLLVSASYQLTLTFLSLEHVASRWSSGEKAQQSTSSSWAWISVSFSPEVLLNTWEQRCDDSSYTTVCIFSQFSLFLWKL